MRFCIASRVTECSAGAARFAQLSRLERLDLSDTPLTGECLDRFAGLAELRVLRLDATRIADAQAPKLAKLRHLEDLSLARTKVGDEGSICLAPLARLRELNLDGTEITDAGLVCLASLDLNTLRLCGTKIVGIDGSHSIDGAGLPDNQSRLFSFQQLSQPASDLLGGFLNL